MPRAMMAIVSRGRYTGFIPRKVKPTELGQGRQDYQLCMLGIWKKPTYLVWPGPSGLSVIYAGNTGKETWLTDVSDEICSV